MYHHSTKCEVCAAQTRESTENEERSWMGRSMQGRIPRDKVEIIRRRVRWHEDDSLPLNFGSFAKWNAGDVFIERALEVPRSGWRWAGGRRENDEEKEDEKKIRGGNRSRRTPFFLFLRRKKRVGVKSGGGRGREGKEEERGEDEHLYKDLHGQWEWNAGTSLVPDFIPISSPPDQFPLTHSLFLSLSLSLSLSPLLSRRHRTLLLLLLRLSPSPMLLTESSPCSLYQLYHLLLHYYACLLNYHYAPLPLCSTTIIIITAFDCCSSSYCHVYYTRSHYYLRTFSSFYYWLQLTSITTFQFG